MSKLLPYETIVKAHEGDPDAINTVLSHYAGYIRHFSKVHGHINAEVALDFYGPIFLLYSIYDGTEDKERMIELVEQHVNRFSEQFMNKKEAMADAKEYDTAERGEK